jgi:hypothetical protein
MNLQDIAYEEIIVKSQQQDEEKAKRPRRGRVSKKPKNYFTQETENAIILYNKLSWTEDDCMDTIASALEDLTNVDSMTFLTSDEKATKRIELNHLVARMTTQLEYTGELYLRTTPAELSKIKNEIYSKFIKYPLEKIVENMYNKYKLTYFDAPPDHIQAEAVHNLLLNLHKFDDSRGAKAFSYFTVVAKHHLMQVNNSNYRRYKRASLVSSMPDNWEIEDDFFERENVDDFVEFRKIMLGFWEENLTRVFTKRKDIQIADAILELFRRSTFIENFNKKHLYLLIREMADCKTQHITRVVNLMKKTQTKMVEEYRDTGNIVDTDYCFESSFKW